MTSELAAGRTPWKLPGALLLAGTCLAPGSGARASDVAPDPLVFAGSGANLAIVRRLADSFERARLGVRVEVPPSIGSTGGIRAAADGAIAAGLISRPLTAPEKALGLAIVPYARTALVIGAHPTVADEEITLADLVKIYRGQKARWRDGREIVVLTRQPDDSYTVELERRVPGFKEAYADSHRARRWIIVFTDQAMNRKLAQTPFALGFTDLGTMTIERLPIKALKVDGTPPTPESIRSGRYPLFLTLSFVFRPEKLPGGARAFIDWVRSSEGERVLRADGFAPAG